MFKNCNDVQFDFQTQTEHYKFRLINQTSNSLDTPLVITKCTSYFHIRDISFIKYIFNLYVYYTFNTT